MLVNVGDVQDGLGGQEAQPLERSGRDAPVGLGPLDGAHRLLLAKHVHAAGEDVALRRVLGRRGRLGLAPAEAPVWCGGDALCQGPRSTGTAHAVAQAHWRRTSAFSSVWASLRTSSVSIMSTSRAGSTVPAGARPNACRIAWRWLGQPAGHAVVRGRPAARTFDVGHVDVVEAADAVHDGVHLADVLKELVAEASVLARAAADAARAPADAPPASGRWRWRSCCRVGGGAAAYRTRPAMSTRRISG